MNGRDAISRVRCCGERRAVAGVIALLLLAGCTSYDPPGTTRGDGVLMRRDASMRPTVAVTDFDNKASFSGQWNLGQGIADLVVAKLVETERVEVLERQHIGDVVGEIVRQGQEFFRQEGRVEKGKLKNAQYLIRGVVNDFTVTGDASGWFGVSQAAGVKVKGQKARVAIAMTLSDVTTGEIISATKADGTVSAGGFGAGVNYKSVSFGGDAYFRTPLGKATEIAIGRAVKKILHDLPAQLWQARVAEAAGDTVILNGGRNAGVRVGDIFFVREPPKSVTDPVTGNVIDRLPGRLIGKLEVKTVNETSSHATLVQGAAKRGDHLEEAK